MKVNDDILNESEILDLLEDIAYVGGAVMEEDNFDYCDGCIDGDCANCHFEDDEEDEHDNDDNEKQ